MKAVTIPFLYRIPVYGAAPPMLYGAIRQTFSILNTDILKEKGRASFKKVEIFFVKGLENRVEYSPITGRIEIDPSPNKIRDRRKGIRTNLILALSMAFYDFGLSANDRTYWKALSRNISFKVSDAKKGTSFGVSQVGKPRWLFAGLLLAYFNGNPSKTLTTFLRSEEEALIELSPSRHRQIGIPSREMDDPIQVGLYGETLPLRDALDIVGITGITPQLKRLGCRVNVSYDPTLGNFSIIAKKNGVPVLEMERKFDFNSIKNEKFFLSPELQGRGLGLSVFATQVTQAVTHGIGAINTQADRNDDTGMAGYNIWWKFGFDGKIFPARTKNPEEARNWFEQAVLETIIGYSEMSLNRLLYDLMSSLKERMQKGSFSPSAYRYLNQVVLEGQYQEREDFNDVSTRLFVALVESFNEIEPESEILQKFDLSYHTQRIQRMVQVEGFTEWWEINGGKWEGSADLSEGMGSEVVALLRNYLNQRGSNG